MVPMHEETVRGRWTKIGLLAADINRVYLAWANARIACCLPMKTPVIAYKMMLDIGRLIRWVAHISKPKPI